MSDVTVTVVGGGLAGCECALCLADSSVGVRLYEMRPSTMTPAHRGGGLAELVCSNSLKSTRVDSAAGLLKAELDMLGCHLLAYARQCAVPAGGALAVDRDAFSRRVEEELAVRANVEIVREEVRELPADGPVVIAAGPLCSKPLIDAIMPLVGNRSLSFFDAAAPIVDAASLNRDILFAQSRYDDGKTSDYLNAPMDRQQYDAFVDALVGAERVILRDFERRELFQACQPVEEVARTGHDALRFGALKPVGIVDPRTGRRPWAVVQLRAENRDMSAYNLVGFQTNLTFPEQRRVFGMIPGLEGAEFFRYGVMHRNTFIDAPRALDESFALRSYRRIRFAGQITGTEGYVEAMATGLMAALNTFSDLTRGPLEPLPATGALGSLMRYASDPDTLDYQPMHANFGLVPPISPSGLASGRKLGKRERYQAYSDRALEELRQWLQRNPLPFGRGA